MREKNAKRMEINLVCFIYFYIETQFIYYICSLILYTNENEIWFSSGSVFVFGGLSYPPEYYENTARKKH